MTAVVFMHQFGNIAAHTE